MADYNHEADAITAALFRAQGEAGLARLYLRDRRAFDRRMERGREHFFGPPSGAHASADDDHVEGEHHRERDQRDQNPLADAVAMRAAALGSRQPPRWDTRTAQRASTAQAP